MFYNVLVQAVLDYAACVWGYSFIGHSDTMLRIQKHATRIIMDAPWDAASTALLSDINIHCVSCVPCGTCGHCVPCTRVSPVSLLVWNLCPLWPLYSLCPLHPLCPLYPLWPLSCPVLSCLAQGKRIPDFWLLNIFAITELQKK